MLLLEDDSTAKIMNYCGIDKQLPRITGRKSYSRRHIKVIVWGIAVVLTSLPITSVLIRLNGRS